ncbi:MAG: hypothetical protein LBC85_07085, partial [Fibromonadaceae bacterium]|nr:hypothetical protein [Fibromonadaceae bacterium]
MKKLPLLFLILLSCQGPWSYYPEDPEVYQGIWTSAYVISGRPMEDVCFDRIHALDEIRMPAFAFYEEASVKVTGAFTGKDTSFYLQPDIANRKPNCFVGPKDLVAMPGKNYELDVSITWDSLGKKTTSNFSAKTYIPQKFKVLRAYDLLERQHSRESFLWPQFAYLPPPMDMRSNYFIPEYSDDVAGVQVSMVYDDRVTWGENFIMQIIERFDIEEGADTARYAKFGDRNHVYFARNMEIAGTVKDIDSIPVLGFLTPADGYFKLL